MAPSLPQDDVAGSSRMIEIAAAFGQGTGTALLEVDAAQALQERYGEAVRMLPAGDWQQHRLAAFEWARTFGRLAAFASSARGGESISRADILSVINVDRSLTPGFGACPFTLAPGQRLAPRQ